MKEILIGLIITILINLIGGASCLILGLEIYHSVIFSLSGFLFIGTGIIESYLFYLIVKIIIKNGGKL